MPGTRLASGVRPGLLRGAKKRRHSGSKVLGKSKDRWVLRELGQRGLPSTVR